MAARLFSPQACAARAASLSTCTPLLGRRRAGLKPPDSCASSGVGAAACRRRQLRRVLPATVAASGRPEHTPQGAPEDTPEQHTSTPALTSSSKLLQAADTALSFALLAPIHLAGAAVEFTWEACTGIVWRLPAAIPFVLACTLAWKPLPGVGGSQTRYLKPTRALLIAGACCCLLVYQAWIMAWPFINSTDASFLVGLACIHGIGLLAFRFLKGLAYAADQLSRPAPALGAFLADMAHFVRHGPNNRI